MTYDIIARLKECWCADAFTNRGLVDPACDHDGVRAEAADEIERLRKECDHYWATTNDAISERNHWLRLFKLAFNSHFDKTWDEETADLLGQSYDEAECICGDDKL